MFQQAAQRVSDLTQFETLKVIASADSFSSRNNCEADLAAAEIVLDPAMQHGRGSRRGGVPVDQNDPRLWLSPADHRIADVDLFRAGVRIAAEAASQASPVRITPIGPRPATATSDPASRLPASEMLQVNHSSRSPIGRRQRIPAERRISLEQRIAAR